MLARLFSFGRQEGAFVVTVSYLALFPKKPTTLASSQRIQAGYGGSRTFCRDH